LEQTEKGDALPPRPPRFGLYLGLLTAFVLLLYVGGAAYTHFIWSDIAPQFTPAAPLNQKVLFFKRNWPRETPSIAVVGASMALNNFDSDYLQAATGRPVMNLGANGLSSAEYWDLYHNVKANFPISDVILISQFNEMRDTNRRAFVVPPKLFHRYVSGQVGWVEEFSYRDLVGFLFLAMNEHRFLVGRSDYTSSAFTRTGAVPLDIYGAEIDASRWNPVNLSAQDGCLHCGEMLTKMCAEVRGSGGDFTLVVPPLSPYVQGRRPDVRARYAQGRERMRAIIDACHGKMFDAEAMADFSDECFVDFEHLNAKGMRALTEIFVQWRKSGPPAKRTFVTCDETFARKGGSGLAASLDPAGPHGASPAAS
jgi:hypothetical protein